MSHPEQYINFSTPRSMGIMHCVYTKQRNKLIQHNSAVVFYEVSSKPKGRCFGNSCEKEPSHIKQLKKIKNCH